MVGVPPTGIGGSPMPPPSIRENETSAMNEVTKKFVMSLVMDTLGSEVISFTQREYNELFKYSSEPDRPTLTPLMQLRSSGTQPYASGDETWQPAFQELMNSLPTEVKGWVSWEMSQPPSERDPAFVAVNNLFTTTAKALDWLSAASPPVLANTQAERNYVQNVALPYVALTNGVSQSETILDAANTLIGAMGANHPNTNALSNLTTQMETSLETMQSLTKQATSGTPSAALQQQFVGVAYDLNQLSKEISASSPGNDLQILSVQLNALAVIASAWAVSSGPSPLLLGITLSTIGLTSETSSTAAAGPSYNTAMNALLDGILGSVGFGPRAQLNELNGLYNELVGLR